ncbi:Oidioi.mRNA.OKI2018_I69.XSR.g14937.t1.cds [Oikopleura dioica]|uniref:Oidioi.mRNA.OKI2018_I69.XSR.g14937.t1.cds n=1 Tax=Oikopleura dioica TaxID=34765 RepID=A0ABN7SBA0_OIKDI|nr:Oidioi.mRNA.OKI2018_I69.XSR.g14937.t1.cds [Oikopleura dioica]
MNYLSDDKRRFLDYLFFVAPQDSDDSETSVISKKYPKEDYEESSLPADVAYFCQPEGNHIEKFYGGSAVMKDSSFVFTLTDKDTSSTRYGVCHNFYVRRKSSDETKDKLVSICILTNHQFISGFRTVLATLKKITDSADRCCREMGNFSFDIWDYFTKTETRLDDFPLVTREYIQIIESWISMLLDSPVPEKVSLPQDVWVVDLDTNKIYQPKTEPDLPKLPEAETNQLKSHLFQALKAMGSEENYRGVDNIENAQGKVQESYIYGNDVECVDVATRVAMIRFFDSPGVLRGAHKHMRTLRLYPRPVVAFQADCFLQSIESENQTPVLEDSFISKLSRTQAVEYLGEWSLSPSNVAFMRIQNGIWDPALIGDKPKWFAGQIESVNYNIASVLMLDQILKNADKLEAGEKLDSSDLGLKKPTPGGFHERPENLVLTRTRPPVSRGQSVQMGRSASNSSVASSHKSSNSPMLRHNAQNDGLNVPSGLSERQNEIRSIQQAKQQARQKRRLEITQDAELIREAAREALDGNGVSWIRLRKIKKLMESESWRLYMLSRLNQLTQREENTIYVESVEISPKAFKGISDLLKAVEAGLESNFKEKKGHGGLSSVFFLMEIGHTHYCTKEDVKSPRQSLSESFSSFDNTVKAARIVAQGALTQINRQISHHKISELRLSTSSAASEPTSIGLRRELKYRAGKMIEVETDEDENEVRVYLYEALSREENAIWKSAQLWENAFLDVVSLERDALGMEHGPTDMIVRYKNLAEVEKRRLENDEDQLLVTVLYNMSAFMIMMNVDAKIIRRKSFVVHAGTSAAGEVLFLEVCTDALILRNGMGTICERWWHEKLINMTFCPKTKILRFMRNDITHAYWYHGVISRASAESVLELDGDFLVRASLNNGQEQYVVSCKSRTSFLHIVLLCEQDKYMILEDFEKKDSIEELISTYMDNKHPVSKLSMTILKRPISHLRHSSKRLDNEAPCLDNSQPLDNQSIDKIIDVLNKTLQKNSSCRNSSLRRDQIFFQALLVLGDLRKSCLLLDQLVLCCYELYQTLKCDSALSHILYALKSETVARHTKLWNKFKKDHIVSFLTYQRILQPISEDRKENRLFLKYQRDCFKLIDDDQFLEDLSIAKMVQLVFDARESHLGSGRQDALANCRGAIKSEMEGSADSALAKIFSLGYQEKLLLEPGVSVFDETSKKSSPSRNTNNSAK